MKKFVTLNEYIASLQKIAQKHGNAEVLSLGSVTGTAGGLQNPRSVHLVINGKEETFYVPCYQEERKPNDDSPWNDGRLQIAGCTFRFWIKRFDEGSEFGIEGGRISKLTIKNERTGKGRLTRSAFSFAKIEREARLLEKAKEICADQVQSQGLRI